MHLDVSYEYPQEILGNSRGTPGGIPEELLGEFWRNSRGSPEGIPNKVLEEFPRNS